MRVHIRTVLSHLDNRQFAPNQTALKGETIEETWCIVNAGRIKNYYTPSQLFIGIGMVFRS